MIDINSYKEIVVSYDIDLLLVEVDGLDKDDFWHSILIQDDLNDPEEYAYGVFDVLSKLYPGIPISIQLEDKLEDED